MALWELEWETGHDAGWFRLDCRDELEIGFFSLLDWRIAFGIRPCMICSGFIDKVDLPEGPVKR